MSRRVDIISSVYADFYRDWHAIADRRLRGLGYAPDPGWDVGTITRVYTNALWRQVPARPRAVRVAKGVHVPAECAQGFNQTLNQVRLGKSLLPRLSRSLKKVDFDDLLLNDWGIHHLHLGTEVESDGFVRRTRNVAFVMFTDVAAHVIAVLPHGPDNPTVWTRKQLLNTVHAEWPELLAPYKLSDVIAVDRDFTDEEHLSFRKAGLTVLVRATDGTVYAPPGDGYASAGNSVRAMQQAHNIFYRVANCEDAVRNNPHCFVERLRMQGWTRLPVALSLSLRPEDGRFGAMHLPTSTRFVLE
jgi:hypothetical protein